MIDLRQQWQAMKAILAAETIYELLAIGKSLGEIKSNCTRAECDWLPVGRERFFYDELRAAYEKKQLELRQVAEAQAAQTLNERLGCLVKFPGLKRGSELGNGKL